IILKLNLNSQALFIALSGLTMLFLYKGIKYHTKDNYTFKPVLYIILLLFAFLPSLNVVRQVLAASIILYASKYIINIDIINFYIWVLFAMLFHYASIIFLVFYFLASKNFKRTTLLFSLFLSYLLANFGLISTILDFIYV